MRAAQWAAFGAFLLFAAALYNWKSGGVLDRLTREAGAFPYSLGAAPIDPHSLLGVTLVSSQGPAFWYTVAYSLLVVGTPGAVKVHVHTDEPGKALALGTAVGVIEEIDIKNMHVQTAERTQRLERQAGVTGAIAVCLGAGNRRLFESLGAVCVEGGETMNPSTADITAAIESLPEAAVVVLPNSKNVVMAAEQAAATAKRKADKAEERRDKAVAAAEASKAAKAAGNEDEARRQNAEARKQSAKASEAAQEANDAAQDAEAAYEEAKALNPKPTEAELNRLKSASEAARADAQRASRAADAAGEAVRDLPI